MPRSSFSTRAMVTLVLFWCFTALLVSGVVLYVAPQGRIANWTDWSLLGLDKHTWASVHTVVALLFVIGGLLHFLSFNRGALLAYLRRARGGERRFGLGVLAGSAAFVVVLVGTLTALPPFSSVTALGERARSAWAAAADAPPVPHMEDERLSQAAARVGRTADEVRAALAGAGLAVPAGDVTLAAVATANGRSPRDVWQALQPPGQQGTAAPATPAVLGAGLGRRTLGEVAEALGMTPAQAVARLAERGVAATPAATMKELATAAGMSPHDLGALLLPRP